jgi:hypothetical protein
MIGGRAGSPSGPFQRGRLVGQGRYSRRQLGDLPLPSITNRADLIQFPAQITERQVFVAASRGRFPSCPPIDTQVPALSVHPPAISICR